MTLRSDKLTDKEIEVLNHLANAWNSFSELDSKSENDVDDFRYAIDLGHAKIALRMGRRTNPENRGIN